MASFTHYTKFLYNKGHQNMEEELSNERLAKKFRYTRSLSEGQACRRGKSGNKQFSKESLGRDKFSLIRGPQQIA